MTQENLYNSKNSQGTLSSIINLFKQSVRNHPDKLSIVESDFSLSFKELDVLTDKFAQYLRKKCLINKVSKIIIYLGRSHRYIITVLSALKAQAAFVPIDIKTPAERLKNILTIDYNLIITEASLEEEVSAIENTNNKLLLVDLLIPNLLTQDNSLINLPSPAPEALACIIYTSGTTGKPKGVLVNHGNLLNYTLNLSKHIGISSDEVVDFSTNVSFDLTITTTISSLCLGALIVPYKGEVEDIYAYHQHLRANQITLVKLVPSYIELITEYLPDTNIKKIILGGEKLAKKLVRVIRKEYLTKSIKLLPIIYDEYGPTEATVGVYIKKYHLPDEKPICFFYDNVSYCIVDSALNLVTSSQEGELLLGGTSITDGYINDPHLTSQKFITLSFLLNSGKQIFYKTGDLVKKIENNELEFKGRCDAQIKIRGFRIEPGEIEAVIESYADVKKAIVLALDIASVYRLDSRIEKTLVAFILPGDFIPSIEVLEDIVKSKLPDYMVPKYFIFIDKIPLTLNGKIDNKALRTKALNSLKSVNNIKKPSNEIESQVLTIWSEILAIAEQDIATDVDFVKLGGDSILIIQMIHKLRKVFNLSITMKDILETKNIIEIANLIVKLKNNNKIQHYFPSSPDNRISHQHNSEFSLLPIQKWFFSLELCNPNFWNQSFVIKVPKILDIEKLKKAVTLLHNKHGMLRLCFRKKEDNCQYVQYYNPKIVEPDVKVLDFTGKGIEITSFGNNKTIQSKFTQWQSHFDIENGPLYSIGYLFDLNVLTSYLHLSFHHLIIDAVSWRIISDDLKTFYEEQDQNIIMSSNSYKDWIEITQNYTFLNRDENLYWAEFSRYLKYTNNKVKRLKPKFNKIITSEFNLNKEQTDILLRKIPIILNTQINDVLLTAFNKALSDLLNTKKNCFFVEGHGREEIFPNINISRTVGWFTSVYPVLITAQENLIENLKETQEVLNRIPNNGIGYGFLNGYNTDDKALICFNYLGQFVTDVSVNLTDKKHWSIIIKNCGVEISPKNKHYNIIDVKGYIIDNILTFEFKTFLRTQHINKLMLCFKRYLQEIIEQCLDLSKLSIDQTNYLLTEKSFNSKADGIIAVNNLVSNELTNQKYGLLSFVQERLWFIEKYEQGTNAYNIPFLYRIKSDVEIEALKKSIISIVARHEVLRSFIKEDISGGGYSTVCNKQIDIRETEVNTKEELDRNFSEDVNHIFNLASEYPIRISIYRLFETKLSYYLSVVVHHIAFDGWSIDIFLHELQEFYKYFSNKSRTKLALNLPILENQYTNFALWQKNHLIGETLNNQLSYWKNKLSGYDILNLITDYPRPLQIDYKGKIVNFELGEELSDGLRQVAKKMGVSLYTLLLTAYYLMLRSYSGQSDIIIGTPVANRYYKHVENLIGSFVNTLALRINLDSANITLDNLVKKISRLVKEAQIYQDLPFEKLVDELNVPKETNRHPVFQVMFVLQTFGQNIKNNICLEKYIPEKPLYNIAKFDLETFLYDGDDQIKGEFNYAVSLFEEKTIVNFKNTYISILQQIVTSGHQELKNIYYLSRSQYNLLVKEQNTTTKLYPNRIIFQLFADQVKRTPDNIAIVYEGLHLSYQELNKRSNKLAHYLINKYNLKPNTLVAIGLDRNENILIAILAILKSGGAYVPIDLNNPDERIKYIINDTKSPILITDNSQQLRFRELVVSINTEILVIDDQSVNIELVNQGDNNPCINLNNNLLAYVIYTSGTMGNPKGVLISHQNVTNYILNLKDEIGISSVERVDFSTSIGFDLTVTTTLGSLCLGGQVVIYSAELQDIDLYEKHLIENKITLIKLVPSFFELIIDKIPSTIRKVILGGEKVHISLINKLSFLNHRKKTLNVYDEYGPTETTVGAYLRLIWPNNKNNLGKPYNNYQIYILNASLQLVPYGGVGELYIGGEGVAIGYLGQKSLTALNFIANPFRTQEEVDTRTNSRLYKTGDRVRCLVDGNLDYIGRTDTQLKIRGYRIELAEIEAVLAKNMDIKQVAVSLQEDPISKNKILVAYCVAGEFEQTAEELKDFIKISLPQYMIPSLYIWLDQLPVTINGKVDYRALPKPEFINNGEYTTPRNDLESKICSIFAEVLGLNSTKVGIKDDFFKLGGDSIISIQLVSRLRQRLSLHHVTIKDIFSYKTVEKFYDNVIKTASENNAEAEVIEEQGFLSGKVALLPIQQWFFNQNFKVPYHWNQSFIIQTPELNIEILKACLKVLIDHHDALRLRYNNENIQYYDDKAKAEELKLLNINTLASYEEYSSILTLWQSNFNLQTGPIYSIGYIYGFEDGSSRIFFALHHLIVDTVSWRILTEDLKNLYYSITIEESEDSNNLLLTQKGTSYRQWAEIVESYAEMHEEERSYWDNVIADIKESTNKLEQVQASATSSEFSSVSSSLSVLPYAYSSLSLDKELTSKLLKESNRAYNTEVNDLLLSALSLSLNQIIGSNVNHITLEGHGREEGISNKPLDISRTVGWFTTMYPVRLEVGRDQTGDIELAETIASTIKYTKELLRGVPNKGIGFGSIIGYKEELLPKISFNYLGQLDQVKDSKSKQSIDKLSIDIDSSKWNITDESSGISIGEGNQDKNIININGSVVNGILSFSIATKLSNELTQKLAEVFKQQLISIINYTSSLARSYLTVSDIVVNKIISQAYLDRIQEDKEIDGVYIANSLQQGFIYHYLNQGDIDDAYIVQSIWQYKNRLDLVNLKAAWELAQAKYPTLRLRFSWEEELVQVIDSVGQLQLDWRYIDISQDEGLYDTSKQEEKIKEIQERDREERYSLGKGNLFRVYIIKQREDLYSCILSEHHAIIDGWSSPILLQFVHETYKSLCKGVGKEKINNSVDQAYLDAQVYLQRTQEKHEGYWYSYIDTIEERVDLGVLVSKAKTGVAYHLSNHKQVLDPQEEDLIVKSDIYNKLKALSQREGITLNAILQYVWHKVLKIYGSNNSGGVCTIVGTTVSGRNIPIDGIEESVGLYINTLPLIVRHDESIDARTGIIAAIRRVQSDVTEINSRSNTNLSRLQKEGSRLFDTLFVFENYPIPINSEESQEVSLVNIEFKQAIEKLDYPLSVIVYEIENGLSFRISYAGELFEVDLIKKLLSTVDVVLEQVSGLVEGDDIKLQDLSYLSREDIEVVLSRWNDTEKEFPYDKKIHRLFEEQVERTPDSIALVYKDSRLTYQELNERANRLAYYLVTNYNIRPDTLVPLLLDRSENMLIGILAVLKSGGAYVPMDPGYPDERIGYILKDTNARIVIANEVYKERLEGIVRDIVSNVEKTGEDNLSSSIITRPRVDKEDREDIDISINIVPVDSRDLEEELYQLPSIDVRSNSIITSSTASNLAYVIYTSGTTGNPKGVLIEHKGVTNLLISLSSIYKFLDNKRFTQFTSYVFDVSISELFTPIIYGGSLYILEDRLRNDSLLLANYINLHEINYIYLPPVVLSNLPRTSLPTLEQILYAGEPCDINTVQYWSKKCKLYNYYGPTETTIYSTGIQIDIKNISSIGNPISNTKSYILDNNLSLLSIGAIGELYIGGVGIARGYLNRPELTAERFIANPFQTDEEKKDSRYGLLGRNARLYKTGDLVRWLPDGNLEYIGRSDFQVKIRGFRIELGEIESVLSSYTSIKQCVVIAREYSINGNSNKYVVAYYTTTGAEKLDDEVLRTHLSSKLPVYMVPSAFVFLDNLPLTINGKLDRKVLPDPEFSGDTSSYVAPRNEVEVKLCSIFASVLGHDSSFVGITDDFFKLGGNSILAIKLINELNKKLKLHIELKELFRYRNVMDLSDAVISTEQIIEYGTI